MISILKNIFHFNLTIAPDTILRKKLEESKLKITENDHKEYEEKYSKPNESNIINILFNGTE